MNVSVPTSDLRGARARLAMFRRLIVGCGRDSPKRSHEERFSPGPQKRMAQSLMQARVDKENKYPELLNGRCRLVVVGLEREADEVVRLWTSFGSPILHFSPNSIGVGTPMDKD